MNPNTNDEATVIAVERDGEAPPTVTPLPAWEIVLVRATRAAISSLLGGGTALGGGAWLLGLSTQTAIKAAAFSAVGAFVFSALQNTAELLGRLDQTNPRLRG